MIQRAVCSHTHTQKQQRRQHSVVDNELSYTLNQGKSDGENKAPVPPEIIKKKEGKQRIMGPVGGGFFLPFTNVHDTGLQDTKKRLNIAPILGLTLL